MPTPGERLDRNSAGMPYKPEGRRFLPYDIDIVPEWNGRDMNSSETQQHIEELKASIRARIHADPPLPALIYPVKIRFTQSTGKARLIAGECRLTACRQLFDEGETNIYVPTVDDEKDATELQLMLSAMTENSQYPLTKWENGKNYRRLSIGYGMSPQAIAEYACKSAKYVTEAIELARTITSSNTVKNLLGDNQVTAGAVLHTLGQAQKELGEDTKQPASTEAISKAAEALHEAVAAQPHPTQATILGTKPARVKPISRPKAASKKDQNIKTVLKAVHNLMKSIDEDDLTNEDFEDVSVNRELLLALHRAI